MWIAWAYVGIATAGVVLFWLIVWTATAAIHQPPPSEDDEPDLFTANNAVRGAAEPRTLDGLVGASELEGK